MSGARRAAGAAPATFEAPASAPLDTSYGVQASATASPPGMDLPDRHPPRPRLTLNVGITGHRANILPDNVLEALHPLVDHVFRQLGEALQKIHGAERAIFDSHEPQLRLHTPLATGADQLAAISARANGYHVRALLPFSPDEYRNDFAEGRELDEFNRQLGAADEIFALPCERSDGEGAYVQVGKAVVAAADILVAIWDGCEGNGPGGTAHVVDVALSNSVPVIHVAIDRTSGKVSPARLLTGGDSLKPDAEPLSDGNAYFALLKDTLTPHTQLEREQIAAFLAEREKRTNWRFEYPLLLSMSGVKSLPSMPWRQTSIAEDIERDWGDVRDIGQSGPPLPLAPAYAWANFLAIRYAQLFRSGHVTNYVLSASAVILALLGLIFPSAKVFLVVAELATIGLLFFNTRAGTKGDWHRKWLQYRHLAESLRPLIYLKRTGMVSPPFRSDFIHGPLHREAGADWTRWYSAAIWRQMASPRGILNGADVRQLAEDVLREQVVPQAGYHRINAERMHKLDHRLHEAGNALMGAVIAGCLLFLAAYGLMPDSTKALMGPFIFLTAGLPAIGAAVFGMRGHGEHLLAASRSANTVLALEANAARLEQVTKLESLAAELENTAAIMLADLNEWTVAYRERSLEIPA